MRRFHLRQFYGSDTQTPYVYFGVVWTLLDDLWSHPKAAVVTDSKQKELRRADLCLSFCQGITQLGGHTKISQFYFSLGIKKDVTRLGGSESVSAALLLYLYGLLEETCCVSN